MLPVGCFLFGAMYVGALISGRPHATDYLTIIPFCCRVFLATNLFMPSVVLSRLRMWHFAGDRCIGVVVRKYGWFGVIFGYVVVAVQREGRTSEERRCCYGLPDQIRPLSKGDRVEVMVSWWKPNWLGRLGGCLALPASDIEQLYRGAML